jgi:multidrug efflux system membrane fusion protein
MLFRFAALVSVLGALSMLSACAAGSAAPSAETTEAAAEAPLVSVTTLKAGPVSIWDELPARISAYRAAEVRPQVSGLILKRSFEEGSEVRQGQALFQIAPEPFLADVASAEAALQKSRAVLEQAEAELERSDMLRRSNNISAQAYDQVASQAAQAKADVAQAEAALNKARLALELATVRAPIDGQIGAALVSEGSLAESTSAASLATIQQITKVHVDIRQPAARLEHLRALARGGLEQPGAIPIEVLPGDSDGDVIAAKALFSDIGVDEGTGNVRLRAIADNPDRRLRPGMNVRVRVPRGIYPRAVSVPQQAVIRDATGAAQVYVVGSDGNATARPVTLGELAAGRYIVTEGLVEGDRIVVEGQDKLSAPGPVRTVEFGTALSPDPTTQPAH